MGRKRQSRKDLPPRVYVKHGAYYYVAPSGSWKRLAKVGDERAMRMEWANIEQATEVSGTVAALLDEYLSKYSAKHKAPRSFQDNLKEAEYLKVFFGKMRPQDIQPRHVGAYLEVNRATRAVRANREKALLSHMFTWAMRQETWGCFITTNPCRGVTRNTETKRVRLVEDAEYNGVLNLANENVGRLMCLVYRTLQRPSDLLKIGPRNIIERQIDGQNVKILTLRQTKTKAMIEIVITEEIHDAILKGNENAQFFIHTRAGKAYTLTGITSMFTAAQDKYRDKVEKTTGVRPRSFGIYDLKGKGATEMYQDGIPLEQIQMLAAHESITTTEIYIKARLNKPVMPNQRKLNNPNES